MSALTGHGLLQRSILCASKVELRCLHAFSITAPLAAVVESSRGSSCVRVVFEPGDVSTLPFQSIALGRLAGDSGIERRKKEQAGLLEEKIRDRV